MFYPTHAKKILPEQCLEEKLLEKIILWEEGHKIKNIKIREGKEKYHILTISDDCVSEYSIKKENMKISQISYSTPERFKTNQKRWKNFPKINFYWNKNT